MIYTKGRVCPRVHVAHAFLDVYTYCRGGQRVPVPLIKLNPLMCVSARASAREARGRNGPSRERRRTMDFVRFLLMSRARSINVMNGDARNSGPWSRMHSVYARERTKFKKKTKISVRKGYGIGVLRESKIYTTTLRPAYPIRAVRAAIRERMENTRVGPSATVYSEFTTR